MDHGLKTVEQWVDKCRKVLSDSSVHFGHGTDNALDEAAWLVLFALDVDPATPFDSWQMSVDESQADRIVELLKERIGSRSPLAYLLGEAWFCGLRFKVTPHVMVPRSPIAELIQRGFSPWADTRALTHVLDLCTGSGCIGVAIAVLMPWLRVDAADISPRAVAVAAGNVKAHGVGERVELIESDLFEQLRGRSYGLIVSNPPYVPSAGMARLPREYGAEPEVALAAGDDGLDIALRIMAGAPAHLEPEGVLICEVGESAGRLQELLANVPFMWLEFEHGGEGVFTMDAEQLINTKPEIEMLLENRKNVL